MFTYTPVSEIEALDLMPKGEYQAIVRSCESTTSSKGNPQLTVVLLVYDSKGKEKIVTDYLSEFHFQFKLRHYLVSLFGEEAYTKGVNPLKSEGMGLIVKIYIQEDKNGKYPPKNAVADYLPLEEKTFEQAIKKAIDGSIDPNFNDDVPF